VILRALAEQHPVQVPLARYMSVMSTQTCHVQHLGVYRFETQAQQAQILEMMKIVMQDAIIQSMTK
jgi:tRNA A37 threonylcarbamoyladenosine biosynthesis protein TsaE